MIMKNKNKNKTGFFLKIKKQYLSLKENPRNFIGNVFKGIKNYFYENKLFLLYVVLNVINACVVLQLVLIIWENFHLSLPI